MSFNWITTGGWSALGDVLTVVGGGSASIPTLTFAKGRIYTPQFEVIGVFEASGFIEGTLNTNIFAVTSPGVKIFNIEADASGSGFSFASAGSDFIGEIQPLIFIASLPGEHSVQDEILRATGGPTIAAGLSTWFTRTSSESVQDAEHRWLLEQVQVTKGGSNKDMWYQLLRALGFTGGMGIMTLEYWRGQP